MTAQRRARRWRAAALGTALGLVLPLAACAGTAQEQASGPTKITFWNWYQGSDGPTVEALVKKFNESQSKVVVDMTIMPKDTMIQKLLPAYASGDGPTLSAVGHEMTTQYITKKVVQPIDDFYGEGKLDKALLPKATIDATTYDGKLYGAPMSAAPLMLYYNKALFAKAGITNPPTTLIELAEDAKKITQFKEGENTTNVYGLAQGMFAGIHSWTAYFRNDGGGYVSEDRKTSVLGSQENIKVLNYWTNLFRNDHISPIGVSVPDAQALFAAGRAGMVIDGPWGAGNYKKSGVDFGVIPFPKGSTTQTTMIVGTPILVAAGIPDAQRSAALEFLKFWNSTETQTTWAVKSGYPPTRSDVPMADLSANPIPELFTKAVGAESHMRGVVNFQTILDDVVNPAIQKVMNGEGTAEEVLPEASKQLQQLLG